MQPSLILLHAFHIGHYLVQHPKRLIQLFIGKTFENSRFHGNERLFDGGAQLPPRFRKENVSVSSIGLAAYASYQSVPLHSLEHGVDGSRRHVQTAAQLHLGQPVTLPFQDSNQMGLGQREAVLVHKPLDDLVLEPRHLLHEPDKFSGFSAFHKHPYFQLLDIP